MVTDFYALLEIVTQSFSLLIPFAYCLVPITFSQHRLLRQFALSGSGKEIRGNFIIYWFLVTKKKGTHKKIDYQLNNTNVNIKVK
tara:strand:+ start:21765 stop:22019 length:255 start_codon:yes stop_codon:yes gene_type:complete